MSKPTHEILRSRDMSPRQRYRLLTSVVVPRPIGWLSTRGADGGTNLAPFSYFGALAADPMLVGVSIGFRGDEPKDSLRNIRETGAFCANMVTERHLEAMNQSSGDFPAGVSEFEAAGVPMGEASEVDAPLVADCPVVLECRVFKEVDLGTAPNSLIIGEVVAVDLSPEARDLWDDGFLDTRPWRPVGRLWAGLYALVESTRALDRPRIDRQTGRAD
ncbi:MAG TPA: flavin reductase family protein [Acidobacteriota bacterium]